MGDKAVTFVNGKMKKAGDTGTVDFDGNVNLGNANSDNIVFTGEVDSDIIPDDNDAFDLGSSSKRWAECHVEDLYAYSDIVFSDTAGTFPTQQLGFYWQLNNDEARIYARQPSSDAIDFVFKLSDNNGSTDRFIFWVDDYRGYLFDKYPLYMYGTKVLFHMTAQDSTSPDLSTATMVLEAVTGDVGIGTTDPVYRLDVRDNTTSFVANFQQESSTAGADMIRMDFSAESNPTGQIIYVYDQDNDRIYQVVGNGAGGSTVSTSFTAGHDTVVPQSTGVIPGMIVESTGTVWYKPTDITSETALPKCRLASSDGSKTVFGVVGGFPAPSVPKEEDTPYLRNGYIIAPAFPAYGRAAGVGEDEWQINTMSIGEGVIWVSNINGNIENGDYIESSEIPGHGRKQSDDIMRSKTVAKCTEDINWSLVEDTVEISGNVYKKYLCSCTFHCG